MINDRIKNGEICLSNGSREFKGFDFNNDADYDGDGLKNGEELHVTQENGTVYLVMKSNPLLEHSDGDGISDGEEMTQKTNPLVYQTSGLDVEALESNAYYMYGSAVDTYETSWTIEGAHMVETVIFGLSNINELYRDIMIDYFIRSARRHAGRSASRASAGSRTRRSRTPGSGDRNTTP